jgi:hypothetical protein
MMITALRVKRSMARCFFVAGITEIIGIAASKLNARNIKWRIIMFASYFIINRFTFYINHYCCKK